MDIQTMTSKERSDQLLAWEVNRRGELYKIVFTMLLSFSLSFTFASIAYALSKHWFGSAIPEVNAVIAGFIPQGVWLAMYLQTWGSYVERLLEDIESKLDGKSPSYYTSVNNFSFNRQPLHERLQRIEKQLSITDEG